MLSYSKLRRLILLFLCFIQCALEGQTNWLPILESELPRHSNSQLLPKQYKSYQVDLSAIKAAIRNSSQINLALADGSLKTFQLWEDSILLSPLRECYPDIQSFSGQAIDEPVLRLKLSLSPKTLHAMILSPNSPSVFIDPYDRNGGSYYLAYYGKDVAGKDKQCLVDKQGSHAAHLAKRSHDCVLRSYRLALAATAEYTAYHGGVAEALAAQVATIQRVNGIYERDLAVRLQIIGNNDLLIYMDSLTDPYNPQQVFSLQSQNQANIDALIGPESYDIGHLFYRSDNEFGLADVEGVCDPEKKARAATGSQHPTGDAFDIAFVAHEMGHQFGATHTQQNEDCERTDATAYEPGSGSTIMGYAGVSICEPFVQPSSDTYFHAISIAQIRNFVSTTAQSCAQLSPLQNTAPDIGLAGHEFSIPQGTPFVLSANASDAEGDLLSYCWEQFDREVAPMPPLSSSEQGPLFRSLPPTTNSDRYFPNRYDVASGKVSKWEVLTETSRALNFRVTVRDNSFSGTCVAYDSIRVNVREDIGPFVLTRPNDGSQTWEANSFQEIQWKVAGTDTGAVNCKTVDLFLSTDGGQSYPFLLGTNLPNTGNALLSIPNVNTDSASLMIKCSDNIFWDVSDSLFRISPLVKTVSLSTPIRLAVSPNPNKGFFYLNYVLDQPASFEIRILDLIGNILFQKDIHNRQQGELYIDLSAFPAGIYVLNIPLEFNTISRKIIRLK